VRTHQSIVHPELIRPASNRALRFWHAVLAEDEQIGEIGRRAVPVGALQELHGAGVYQASRGYEGFLERGFFGSALAIMIESEVSRAAGRGPRHHGHASLRQAVAGPEQSLWRAG
jgi:hypothetical protein